MGCLICETRTIYIYIKQCLCETKTHTYIHTQSQNDGECSKNKPVPGFQQHPNTLLPPWILRNRHVTIQTGYHRNASRMSYQVTYLLIYLLTKSLIKSLLVLKLYIIYEYLNQSKTGNKESTSRNRRRQTVVYNSQQGWFFFICIYLLFGW